MQSRLCPNRSSTRPFFSLTFPHTLSPHVADECNGNNNNQHDSTTRDKHCHIHIEWVFYELIRPLRRKIPGWGNSTWNTFSATITSPSNFGTLVVPRRTPQLSDSDQTATAQRECHFPFARALFASHESQRKKRRILLSEMILGMTKISVVEKDGEYVPPLSVKVANSYSAVVEPALLWATTFKRYHVAGARSKTTKFPPGWTLLLTITHSV